MRAPPRRWPRAASGAFNSGAASSNCSREQSVFEPLEFVFLHGAERNGRIRPHFEARFRGEPCAAPMFCFCSCIFLSGFGLKSKKPAIDWQSRVFENLKKLNHQFVPTMPGRQPTRVQMDIYPLDCACFSIGANVVFIYFFLNRAEKKHYLAVFVKLICSGGL